MTTPKAGYYLPNKELVPGTTTIISRFKDSGALMHWAASQGQLVERGVIKHWRDAAENAANIGTQAHEAIEAFIRGNPVDLTGSDPKVKQAYDNAMSWLQSTKIEIVPELQEIQLVSIDYKFGGTPDAIGLHEGKLVLIDWKTSNSVYSDYLIQMAAYRHLIERGLRMDTYQPFGIELAPGAYICRFAKDHGDFASHYFGDLSDAWEQFTLFRRAYEIDKALSKRAA